MTSAVARRLESLRTKGAIKDIEVANLLGTRPDRQGTGVARGLLEPMLARADDDHLPVFLETGARANLAFYERFGFGQLAEKTVPSGPVVWGMLRPSQ